jgi:hypothetical protein
VAHGKSLAIWLTLRTKSCPWRSERRLLHLKPRRGVPTLAQGNALGNWFQISPSPERASQSQTAIAGRIRSPFQGLDSFCDANPGRCPGLKLGRAHRVRPLAGPMAGYGAGKICAVAHGTPLSIWLTQLTSGRRCKINTSVLGLEHRLCHLHKSFSNKAIFELRGCFADRGGDTYG